MEPWYSMDDGNRKCLVGARQHYGRLRSADSRERYAYGGTDGAIHIAEEIPRPGKNIPLAM